MANQAVYSVLDVDFTVNGVKIQGLMSGDDAITYTQNQEKTELIIGADGGGTWNVKGDNSGVLTVNLLASSPSNAVFNALYLGLRTGVSVPAVVIIRDVHGGDLITGDFMIKGHAQYSAGEKDAGRTWMLDCVDPFVNLAGAGQVIT
jgi:hypothetical protein